MRSRTKKLTISLGVAGGAIVAVLAAWVYIGFSGPTELEQWLGRQIVGVIETHVTPRVEFGELDYQAPRTVLITDLQLRVEGQPIIRVERMLLELAEVPRRERPIQIERIELDAPQVHFLATPAGGFLGWSNFVRPDAIEDPESIPPDRRLSDVLVLRHVEIRDGEIVYRDDPETDDAMTLPGVNFVLKTAPVPEEPGWYTLAGTLAREPLLKLALDARVNLDTAVLDVADLKLHAKLRDQEYQALPPKLQRTLRRHDIQGVLDLALSGQIPLEAPHEAAGRVRAELHDARFAHVGVTAPVEKLAVDAELPHGPIRLTLINAAMRAGNRSILSLDSLTLTASAVPLLAETIEIEELVVERPRVLLARNDAGELLGWSNLSSSRPATEETAAPVERMPTLPAENGSLAERFVLHLLDLHDAEITYEPGPGSAPIEINRIDANLRTQDLPDQPGWYVLQGYVRRAPQLDSRLLVRVSPKEALADVHVFEVKAALMEKDYAGLPASAEEFLRAHEIQGELDFTANGLMDLRDPARSDARAVVDVRGARLALDSTIWPIDRLMLDAKVQSAEASLIYDGNLLGGDVRGAGRCALDAPYPFALDWHMANVDIEKTLRATREGVPEYAGRVRSQGQVSGELGELTQTLAGSGTVQVRDGKLLNLPVLKQLASLVARTRVPLSLPRQDTALLEFDIHPDHVDLSSAEVITTLIAARGGGQVYFNGDLDLRVNAGPLKRLQAQLGRVGEMIGSVTDRLVTYTVRGDVSDPKIGVSPLGLGG